MNEIRRQIAARLFQHSRAHDAGQTNRLARYRNLEPESAALLHLLVVATTPKRVLELGTSNGYSTLWLGDACEWIGASLVSVDVDARRLAEAAAHLYAASLQVQLREADVGDVLRGSPQAAWDFVFLDAERPAYVSYWPDLLRTLAPGGLVVIDNVLSHENDVAEVTALIEGDRRLLSTVVPIGAGLRLVLKDRRRGGAHER